MGRSGFFQFEVLAGNPGQGFGGIRIDWKGRYLLTETKIDKFFSFSVINTATFPNHTIASSPKEHRRRDLTNKNDRGAKHLKNNHLV